MIELAELRVFLAAAEECSFSKAATRVHLSQSAVSQNIQALEKSFGVKLFVRRGRSVWLSEAGQVLLPLARDVLGASRLMVETMNNVQSEIVGELVIGCSTASGKYILPNLVANYRREYPNVHIRINILSPEDMTSRMIDGRISLGVVSTQIDHTNIEHQPLFEEKIILIVPADHPWATYGRALPADLVDQPLILRGDNAGSTDIFYKALAQHGISPEMLNVVMEIGSPEAIEVAVEEGNGIAFISELAAARGLALKKIKKIEVEGLSLTRTIYITRNMQYALTRAQDRFWTFAQQQRESLHSQI